MDIEELIESLAKQMDAKGKALDNLNRQIEELEGAKTCLETIVGPLVAGNESAADFVYWHVNKLAGQFGGYGVAAQIEKLTQIRDSLQKDMDFYSRAVALYNRAAKGLPIDDVDPPPGIAEEAECSVFHRDMDHPESRYRLQQGADYHLVNRVIVDAQGCPSENGNYLLPESSDIGDMVCLDGMLHICVAPGAGDSANYYCVGLQEPGAEELEEYGLCHMLPCVRESAPNG